MDFKKGLALALSTVFLGMVLVSPCATGESSPEGMTDPMIPEGVVEYIVEDMNIPVGETRNLTVHNVTQDRVILVMMDNYGYSDVQFEIIGPNGTELLYQLVTDLGRSGLEPPIDGNYTLCCENIGETFNAHVLSTILVIEPDAALKYPSDCSTINNLIPVIEGSFYPFADSISVSVNEKEFKHAEKSNLTEWTFLSRLDPGENVINVKGTIQYGNFTHSVQESFTIHVDTLWIYEEDGDAHLGPGTYGLLVLMGWLGVIVFLLTRETSE